MSDSSIAYPGWRWDIFCSVIDNFGDIGIAWRLSRQLVDDYQQHVRLWVDDLASFQRICPELLIEAPQQTCCGVDIRHWPQNFPLPTHSDLAEIVVEVLGSRLPASYQQQMQQLSTPPLWLLLEYLSAEDWVQGCHGLRSPQANSNVHKVFFFPGFSAGSGGLLREPTLSPRQTALLANESAQQAFWQSLGLVVPAADEIRMLMFAYDHQDIGSLLQWWVSSGVSGVDSCVENRLSLLVPEGTLATQIAHWFGENQASAGQLFRQGRLSVHILSFVDQDAFDQLLWLCDINFVRGEDSFVRAQWAPAPFIWQIYRQTEEAHLPKLEAFLQLYLQGLPEKTVESVRQFWLAWNTGQPLGQLWQAFWRQREVLLLHQQQWQLQMQKNGDLVAKLMLYCQNNL